MWFKALAIGRRRRVGRFCKINIGELHPLIKSISTEVGNLAGSLRWFDQIQETCSAGDVRSEVCTEVMSFAAAREHISWKPAQQG